MILLIAIVLGALVGAAASGEGGALAGALFGWLIVRSLRQQREIEALRKRAEAPVPAAARRGHHRQRPSPRSRWRARRRPAPRGQPASARSRVASALRRSADSISPGRLPSSPAAASWRRRPLRRARARLAHRLAGLPARALRRACAAPRSRAAGAASERSASRTVRRRGRRPRRWCRPRPALPRRSRSAGSCRLLPCHECGAL